MDSGRRSLLTGAAGLLLVGLGTRPSRADRGRRGRDRDHDEDDDRRDHEAAAAARAAGEILPLTDIMTHVKSTHAGEIVGIELDRKRGRWIYEVKLITPSNRFVEIYVDARTRQILKVEGDD